jgi:large subunit ribosomal protein L9
VILLSDVPKIGKKYEAKEVSPGDARNFLFPKKLAEVATAKTLERIKLLQSLNVEKRQEEEKRIIAKLKDLAGTSITIKAKANDKGHLFASVNAEMILEEIQKTVPEIQLENIDLEKPLKEVGEYTVTIKVQSKTATLSVLVEEDK